MLNANRKILKTKRKMQFADRKSQIASC